MNVEKYVFRKIEDIDLSRYFIVTYALEAAPTSNLKEAAWGLALGQSIGNPSMRSEWETEEMFSKYSCVVLEPPNWLSKRKSGIVNIAFPECNINFRHDGITHLLVQIMGGQCDIDIIKRCTVIHLRLTPTMLAELKGPRIGLSGMREYCKNPVKPFFGGIIKPKVGLNPNQILEMVKVMVDGGVNFIKEDECLGNFEYCELRHRVRIVGDYLKGKGVFYCASLQTDNIMTNVFDVHCHGGNGVHVNFWAGLGSYKKIREMNVNLLLHYQKSGDRVFTSTNSDFAISDMVIFDLVSKSGCDTLHCGMLGGYLDSDRNKTIAIVNQLVKNNSVPALSCGMKPDLIKPIQDTLGHNNWMANVGGYLFSHPDGTLAGVKAMNKAIQG